MRVRITMPAKDGKRLKEEVLQGAEKVEDEDWGEEWEVVRAIAGCWLINLTPRVDHAY
jgi:ribosome maturation protein SDO1